MKINTRKLYIIMLLLISCAGNLLYAVEHVDRHVGARSSRLGKSGFGRGLGFRRNFAPIVYGAPYDDSAAYPAQDLMPFMPREGATTHISTSSEYGPGFAKIMTTTT